MKDPMQPENWPAWATESVEIAPANPNWDAQAQDEIRQLKRLLQQFNIHQFEHIGSTSIPGLPAKPIIDLMAEVQSWDDMDLIADQLNPLGSSNSVSGCAEKTPRSGGSLRRPEDEAC